MLVKALWGEPPVHYRNGGQKDDEKYEKELRKLVGNPVSKLGS